MDDRFGDDRVRFDLLRQRAFNLRWATVDPDVIPLTAADPDFSVARCIRDAIGAYTEGGVFSYGPPDGLPTFRAACARVQRERRGIAACEPDHILPTDSAASAMFVAARYVLQPGDEAIVFDPVDFLFAASTEAAGGVVVRSPLDPGTGAFDLDALAAAITPRTKLLTLCNPHNPVGRVLSRAELEAIANLALRHDLWIMSDEVWGDVVYAPHRLIPIASLGPEVAARTLGVYGFSKTFGLAGLRVGFLAAPTRAVRDGLLEVSRAATTAFGVSTLSQVAATAAYDEAWPWFEGFLAHLRRMRDLAVARLSAIPGLAVRSPEGTYVLFVHIEGLGRGSAEQVATLLLDLGRVAVVPGLARWFGPGATGYIRMTFCTSEAVLTEALDRIERVLLA
jgi:aminotransferase